VATAIAYAEQQIGKPYLWGGTGPGAFDCSGLVMMAYKAAGITIPRTSQAQWAWGPQVPASQAEPGDLVFFAGSDGTPASPGHVGLVIGGGKMIEAYATGFPIRVAEYGDRDPVGFTRPWAPHLWIIIIIIPLALSLSFLPARARRSLSVCSLFVVFPTLWRGWGGGCSSLVATRGRVDRVWVHRLGSGITTKVELAAEAAVTQSWPNRHDCDGGSHGCGWHMSLTFKFPGSLRECPTGVPSCPVPRRGGGGVGC
jgi:hypothetical protein